MSDLWHDAVGVDFLVRVFAIIALAERHTFQVLTKRPGRMHSMLASGTFWDLVRTALRDYGLAGGRGCGRRAVPAEPGAGRLGRVAEVGAGSAGQARRDGRRAGTVRELRAAAGATGPAAVAGVRAGLGLSRAASPGRDRGRSTRTGCGRSATSARRRGWPISISGGVSTSRSRLPMTRRSLRLGVRRSSAWWPAGGRHPGGGGPFRPGVTRPMRVGDRNGHGVMLDDDTIAVRMGKGRAGRLLDGRTWDEFPRPARQGFRPRGR